MEKTNDDKRFHNVRVRKEIFQTIGDWAYANDRNLAQCVETALAEWIERQLSKDGGKHESN